MSCMLLSNKAMDKYLCTTLAFLQRMDKGGLDLFFKQAASLKTLADGARAEGTMLSCSFVLGCLCYIPKSLRSLPRLPSALNALSSGIATSYTGLFYQCSRGFHFRLNKYTYIHIFFFIHSCPFRSFYFLPLQIVRSHPS